MQMVVKAMTFGEYMDSALDALAVDYGYGPMDKAEMLTLANKSWSFTGNTYLTTLTGTFKVKADTYKLVVSEAIVCVREEREQPILIVRDETNQYDPNAMPVYWFSGTKRSSLPRHGCRTRELPLAHDGAFLGYIPSAAGGYLNRELEKIFTAPNYSEMEVKVLGAMRKAPMATTNGSARSAPNIVLSIRPSYTKATDPLAAVDIISAIGM